MEHVSPTALFPTNNEKAYASPTALFPTMRKHIAFALKQRTNFSVVHMDAYILLDLGAESS